jgi:hypothetical protein
VKPRNPIQPASGPRDREPVRSEPGLDEALEAPDSEGRWLVRHRCGETHDAEVRMCPEVGAFEIRIASCSPQWHFIDWLWMQGWEEWRTVTGASSSVAVSDKAEPGGTP